MQVSEASVWRVSTRSFARVFVGFRTRNACACTVDQNAECCDHATSSVDAIREIRRWRPIAAALSVRVRDGRSATRLCTTPASIDCDCVAAQLATALMRTANSALPIYGSDMCAWLVFALGSSGCAAGVVWGEKQIPPAPLFQRGELQQQERSRLAGGDAQLAEPFAVSRLAKRAVAPFMKGGGIRAADAGDLLLILILILRLALPGSKSAPPPAPLFQRGELQQQQRPRLAGEDAQLPKSSAVSRLAKRAVAPFMKGGGIRAADAGDLLLILILILRLTPPGSKSESPLPPFCKGGNCNSKSARYKSGCAWFARPLNSRNRSRSPRSAQPRPSPHLPAPAPTTARGSASTPGAYRSSRVHRSAAGPGSPRRPA